MSDFKQSTSNTIKLKACCINEVNCLQLGLPTPKRYEKQIDYVLRLMLLGYSINTRTARYIDIYNLHSVLHTLKRRGISFNIDHVKAYCPRAEAVLSNLVDKAYMHREQVSLYKEKATTATTVTASNLNTGGRSLATNHQQNEESCK